MVSDFRGQAFLNRVASAVPPNDVHDAFVRFASTLLTDARHEKLFRRMADRADIHHRYSVLTPAAADVAGPSVDAHGFFRRFGVEDVADLDPVSREGKRAHVIDDLMQAVDQQQEEVGYLRDRTADIAERHDLRPIAMTAFP